MTSKKRLPSQRPSRRSKNTGATTGIVVQNVNHARSLRRVDAAMYQAMRRALLKVLPPRNPGLTCDETLRAVRRHLPADLFPGGAKAGWWLKIVQLDLEAKKTIARETTRPLRLHRL